MTKISIYSRKQVETLLPSDNSILISIADPGRRHPKVPKGWTSLRLSFHDLDEVRSEGDILVSEMDATLMLEFVEATRPKEIVVNCEAGISRSGGVAVALEEILNENKQAFKKYPNHNRRVTSTILQVWHREFKEGGGL